MSADSSVIDGVLAEPGAQDRPAESPCIAERRGFLGRSTGAPPQGDWDLLHSQTFSRRVEDHFRNVELILAQIELPERVCTYCAVAGRRIRDLRAAKSAQHFSEKYDSMLTN